MSGAGARIASGQVNIFIDLVGNEFSVSFRLARILKVIYLMSLNPTVLF